jgi:hypothetical protein
VLHRSRSGDAGGAADWLVIESQREDMSRITDIKGRWIKVRLMP